MTPNLEFSGSFLYGREINELPTHFLRDFLFPFQVFIVHL